MVGQQVFLQAPKHTWAKSAKLPISSLAKSHPYSMRDHPCSAHSSSQVNKEPMATEEGWPAKHQATWANNIHGSLYYPPLLYY